MVFFKLYVFLTGFEITNYEETHVSRKLQDVLPMMKEIDINISEEDSKSVAAALMKQEIAISQLQHMHISRLSKVLLLLIGNCVH